MNNTNSNNILVSIWCPTYNHEKYIEKCLEGFVMQQTTFPIEIIVHDDASTDNTSEIVKKFEASYPKLFRCIYQSENQYSKNKEHLPKTMVETARGKYINICEGDDYWTDPLKLQKQVEFLEENPNYSICFHNVKIFDQSTGIFREDTISKGVPISTTLVDIAERNFIHTPSAVFKNIGKDLPKLFVKATIGDYPLWCISALKGDIYKMNEEMAVYRVHEHGEMNFVRTQSNSDRINSNDGMIPFYEYMYIQSGIKRFRTKLIARINANRIYAIENNDIPLAKTYAKRALRNHFFQLTFNQIIGNLMVILSPNLYKKFE